MKGIRTKNYVNTRIYSVDERVLGKNIPLTTILLLFLAMLTFSGCQEEDAPMETVKNLDLQRFMGDWYVIANIPTFAEKGTYNNIESYKLRSDGNVDITFSLYTDDEKNKYKEYHPKGFVIDPADPARWKVQFFWPVKFPFYVIELAEDYSYTVIGLPSRSYVWIMARHHQMDESLYQDILHRLENIGYNLSEIKKVPQRW